MAAKTKIYSDTYSGGQGVASTTITAAGSGYSVAPVVTFAAPAVGGVAATGTSTIVSNAVTEITITSPGSGYIVAPAVTIAAPGSGVTATATATLTTGVPSTYTGATVAMVTLSGGHTAAITIDASAMLGGSNGTQGFQKYTIERLEWSLSNGMEIKFTGTGDGAEACHLAAGQGKYHSVALTNTATQPGDATNADIILTPHAGCNGFVLLHLNKEAFV